VLFEEMARSFKVFFEARKASKPIQQEAYKLLLLRTMFDSRESKSRANLKLLSSVEADTLLKSYRLPPKPIDVVKGP